MMHKRRPDFVLKAGNDSLRFAAYGSIEIAVMQELSTPKTLAIDSTGVLSWPDKALSGIPRVESFLIKAALADPDPLVRVVAFKPWDSGFRLLAPFEQRKLADGQVASLHAIQWPGRKAALKSAFEMVRQHPWAKRAADRHLASTATDGGSGFDLAVFKLLIRAYRLYRRAVGRTDRKQAAAQLPQHLDNNITLICQNAVVRGGRPDAGKIAFICHDLIPTVRPDLVTGAKTDRDFGIRLEQLARAGATAFCASDAASVMLTDHMRRAGIAAPVVYRFPMPSILHESAARLGMTSRIEASAPFVLYCSTIEVRKNHIMLARIWQQALEEGVELPKLVCVGRWGWMIDPLRAYLEAHPGLAQSITFTGPIGDEELIRYYRSASFGVFPSHIEGWGYAASECLDFGIPVIVSTTPALIEASGGLMPALDSEDQQGWYAAIRKMAQDEAWRLSLVDRIARQHRPTPAAESWAVIKAGLQESASRR